MKKSFYYFISLSVVMAVIMYIFLFVVEPETSPRAKKGVLDLRNHDFKFNGKVKLTGEWAFYWNQAVSEKTHDAIINQAPDLYVSVPSYWDTLSRIDRRIKPQGTATYSLKILKDFESDTDMFALKTHNITPNADIYVDGRKICEIGNVDMNPEESVAANRTVLVPVRTNSDSITIVIAISNYHNVNGGLNRWICFGLYGDLLAHREKNLAIDSVFLGGLLLMALYQFSVLVLFRRRIAPLYLGLLGLFSFLFAGLKSQMALLTILPNLDGEVRTKIIFFVFSLAGPVFTLYCSNLYPDHFHQKLNRIVLPVAFVMAVLVVFTPMRIYSQFMLPLQLITAGFIGYTVFILMRALYRTRDNLIMLSLFGVEILVFGIVLGIVDNRAQTIFQSIAASFFVFSAYQTVLEAKIFSNALVQIDKLSIERGKLEKQNVDFFAQIFIDRNTGMSNRLLLNDFLHSKWAPDSLKDKHSVSMTLVDVDYFKLYVSTYGHKQSENMMNRLGEIIYQGAADIKHHLLARYGEDSFAMVTADIDEFSLYRSADKLRSVVESNNIEHSFAEVSKKLTVSVGCAIITPSQDNDPETLIDLVTSALVLAKKNGRNRTEIIKA